MPTPRVSRSGVRTTAIISRFTVSPEDAAKMADLHGFTRELMADAERDLGTKLEWVAVDHWNTDNPHIHVLVRGVADDGTDLVISRDYISRGLRARAAERVTLELGPRSELDIRTALEKEVDAERWTSLDRTLQAAVDDGGGRGRFAARREQFQFRDAPASGRPRGKAGAVGPERADRTWLLDLEAQCRAGAARSPPFAATSSRPCTRR